MRLHKRSLLRAFAAGIALCVAFGTAACSGGSTSQENDASADSETPTEQITPIEVVASVNQWGSLAEQIGGVHVKVTSVLSSTDVNAHDFEPKTDDIGKLQQAQVVVSNGAGYDTWATKNLSKTMVSVSAAQMVGAVEGDNPHLWFSSDARNAMAKELADTYSRIMPAQKKYFNNKLTAWNRREKKIEKDMKAFSDSHKNVSYAATEPVAYYLLSDMGFTDNTPEGYLQSSSTNSEPTPTDLQEFQELLEKHKVEVLINDTQSTSDATNTLTGIAYKSDVPVLDISEQMPSDYTSLTSWIRALILSLTDMFDEQSDADDQDATSSDSASENADSLESTADSNERIERCAATKAGEMIVRQKRLPNNRSAIAFAKTILRPTECGMVFFVCLTFCFLRKASRLIVTTVSTTILIENDCQHHLRVCTCIQIKEKPCTTRHLPASNSTTPASNEAVTSSGNTARSAFRKAR